MVVVDASILVDTFIADGRARARIAGEAMVAPHLVDAECGHALRRLVTSGTIDETLARQGLEDLTKLEILRFPHVDLLERAWELRDNLSFYDALYVALAEGLELPLVTTDGRLATAAGIRAIVEVIPAG